MKSLSILIPTLFERGDWLGELLNQIYSQAATHDLTDRIEVLTLGDNRTRTVGTKRNDLMNLARSDYLTFIDDDDKIDDAYLKSIFAIIDTVPTFDVLTYMMHTTLHDGRVIFSKYSVQYEVHGLEGADWWRGKPTHTCIWRADVARKEQFPEINYGEDADWACRVAEHVEEEYHLDEVLYYYEPERKFQDGREPRR